MPRARSSLPNPASNRTDLLTPDAPARRMTSPGQAYGKRTAQAQSQKIVTPGVPAGPTAAPAAAPTPTAAPATPAPAQTPLPGEIPWIGTPGSGGHATTGLPYGPGPGPEALTPGGVGQQYLANKGSEQASLQAVLAHLASQPGASSLVKSLAASAGVQRGY